MDAFEPFRVFQFSELAIRVRGLAIAYVDGEVVIELGHGYLPVLTEITLLDLDEAHVTLTDSDGFEGHLRNAVNIAFRQQFSAELEELADELRRELDRRELNHPAYGGRVEGAFMAGI